MARAMCLLRVAVTAATGRKSVITRFFASRSLGCIALEIGVAWFSLSRDPMSYLVHYDVMQIF